MFVQKIEITGFKSFAKKTILDFSGGKNLRSGVTCVVGPNGSGKSNVSDALRWVIGEKSAKNLRGNKKEDVIFAGSSSKSKLGCAQVSIFFDNSKKRFDIDYDQVIITRKVYRDGENSYYINNSKVRLFDLISLLSKAGIGHGNYTIVNQGMTDQILLANPRDRMNFLEDAAGVKEFQLKKNRSVARIKRTEVNIEKAESLMREIEPELRVLKGQSRKIKKSQKIREELALRKKEYFAVKLKKVEDGWKKNDLELSKIGEQYSLGQALIDKIKNEIGESENVSFDAQREKIEKKEKEKREWEEKRYELERIDFKKEIEFKSLQEKIDQLSQEKIVLVDKKYILSRLENFKKALDELAGKPVTSNFVKKISDLVKEIQAGKAVQSKVDKDVEERKKAMLRELEEIKKKTNLNLPEIKNCQEEIAKINQEIQTINEDIRKSQETRLELKDSLRREEFEVEKAEKYKQHLSLEKDKFNQELKELKKEIQTNFENGLNDLKNVSSRETLEDLKMKMEKLSWQLEQVREIDPSVVEKFEELQEKYDFLKKESEDLELTLAGLNNVIVEMDKIIKQKMRSAFASINKEFAIYFRQIFSGGSAKLEKIKIEKRKLTEDGDEYLDDETEESIEYGLDIKVNPPGKRIGNLSMLSGGERTLTSIALLFALISYNPPPFAFLDEIEANLDESNADKFSKILKKLSHKTQFILATHSREVMRIADILYGITMDKAGYSKVFSVELSQIKEDTQIVK